MAHVTDEEADANADASTDASADASTDANADAHDGDRDAIFEALWARAEQAWDDDKPHQALVEHALRVQMLPELAGRYRALKDDPVRGPRATKQIDRIVAAATQMMFATKSPERTKTPFSWTASAAVMFVLVVGWLAYALFRRH